MTLYRFSNPAPSPSLPAKHPLGLVFSRYYWLQIGLIALAVIFGLTCSGLIVKSLLIKTAMEQEAAHYWHRYDKNHNAALPDTKNLYGYRWQTTPPAQLKSYYFTPGVHRLVIDGHDRVTLYDEHDGNKLLLIFGESNVNRLIWFFGLAPLMISLILLYSVLWLINRKARRYLSPMTQLAQAIKRINLNQPKLNKHPFKQIHSYGNLEAEELKTALAVYHQTLIEFIEREQQFTAEVSHELRTALSVIKGTLELIQYKYPEHSAITRMQNTVLDMQLLMDTLLTIARQGSTPLPVSPVSLSDCIHQICHSLTDQFNARAMNYEIQCKTKNNPIVNAAVVSMIFSNIIRNSLNYSRGQHISIVIDRYRIIIEDDGIGLPAQTLEALKQNTSIPYQGHGIGLKLVKRLCHMINWEVELLNKANLNSGEFISTEGLAVVIYTQ